ncbi:MAG: porin family protein [Deltaproteobacteria bacterium]|nr:porin family protein [Deltaproteobacteria bacterium]
MKTKNLIRFLLVSMAVAGAAAFPALGAEGEYGLDDGWFAGVGAAQTSIGGDLKKTFPMTCYTESATGRAVCPVALDTGTGVGLSFGKRILTNLAVGFDLTSTQHKAADATLADTYNISAMATAVRMAALGVIPFSESWELQIKGGLDIFALDYKNNVCGGGTPGVCVPNGESSSFSGTGLFAGLGMEWLLGNLGFELGYTYASGSLDSLSIPNASGKLPSPLKYTNATALLMVKYHL